MNRYITFTLKRRLFSILVILFILTTVVLTLTHEFGHYIVAKFLGFDTKIHYAYTELVNLDLYWVISLQERFWISLGGPAETMLTGTIGFILLFIFRRSFQKVQALKPWQWSLVFLSFFWIRQPVNFLIYAVYYFIKSKFLNRGDEVRLSWYFDLPNWFIISTTALVATIILLVVIFKFIPKAERFTFLLAGIIGGSAGVFLWLVWLGKIILP